jgi:hypothetical protein
LPRAGRAINAEAAPLPAMASPPQEWTLKPWYPLAFVAALLFIEPGFAQKLVDPNAVAPEFREAALKRRSEQIKLKECTHKADEAKVLPRDRTALINHCLEAAAEK